MVKQWMGPLPKCCDICNKPIKETFVDGRLKFGPWAILCVDCHAENGVGLGEGCGQRYEQNEDRYVKSAG